MPLKNGRLTPRERTFAKEFAETGNLTFASQRARYASPSGGANALERPAIQDRIREIRERRLSHSLELAFKTVDEVMQSASAPDSARVSAADKVFKVAGQYQPGQDGSKDPDDKSVPELLVDAARLYSEANEIGMKLIEHQVDDIPAPPPRAASAPAPLTGGIFD